ncbi:AI-2E family transporter [Algicola sagamiensis]|uniref:AI-2E family transporter n=1 Tax=Algicola sagamiensis TaxID=163869 RepID=UPI0003763249|nr:AI-2E family transporter [Algicola sagamiensis]
MFEIIKQWYRRKFTDPQSVTLFLLLFFTFVGLYWVGHLIVPVLVAIAFAYLLDWPVIRLANFGLKRTWATAIVLTLFLMFFILSVFGIVPVVWEQGQNLIAEAPTMISQGKDYLQKLPEKYPGVVTVEQVGSVVTAVENKVVEWGQKVITVTVSSIGDAIAILIYLVLVPLMVFFMLKDKEELMAGINKLLPRERKLIKQVASEMNLQIMNYIRGKVIEIIIVGSVSYVTFAMFDLRYSALLGLLVGLSVLIPYIGAAVVTLPVAVVALFQFGMGAEFGYIMLAYGIIQALDGNLLVPVLFSEAVDLNPVYIIVAVLFFGGLWGFWGVFFAIPLAALVRAVVNAWSGNEGRQEKPLPE